MINENIKQKRIRAKKIIDIFDSDKKTYNGKEREVENRIRNFVRRIFKKR